MTLNLKSQLEDQIQIQETRDSGWIFGENFSMRIRFCKTRILKGSSNVKSFSRSSVLLNIENTDKKYFIWSILAHLHPCENSYPTTVKNFRLLFIQLNVQGLDFTNKLKSSLVQKFEKMNNLFFNNFEFTFYRDQSKWNHHSIPIQISKNESDIVVDLLFYKNHEAII